MSAVHVSALFQHPVKSCAPLGIERGYIDDYGLAGDRRYLVTDPEGKFLTGRRHPRLASLLATPVDGGIVLAAAGRKDLVLRTAQFPEQYVDVEVWRQSVFAQRCGEAADAWLSDLLGTPARLVYYGALTTRPIKDEPNREVSFADGYPLLLASESSLAWLQERCPSPLVMAQFRPNIVIRGADAWAEDGWQRIRIGTLEFELHSPCERCVFTTLAPRSEHFHPTQEPLRTLIKHHDDGHKAPLFGHNLIAHGTGIVEVGMAVTPL
ncbi:MOSC domain-containing protein [Nitrogeniibacter mangrovi]|uniref:MOSC domain-containing protein n=1 Tax=Nitrogeniibacter mangrovi TaxID=2016596 RepID=A0A6C1B435_9RHOO|nr:MOSC N-terminal beta barrel domain-containing protein [Nitrogeniibacter mangrovi]QID18426.1 MOSC domain-containing protein [Nitrogeniibacter mangrovi]